MHTRTHARTHNLHIAWAAIIKLSMILRSRTLLFYFVTQKVFIKILFYFSINLLTTVASPAAYTGTWLLLMTYDSDVTRRDETVCWILVIYPTGQTLFKESPIQSNLVDCCRKVSYLDTRLGPNSNRVSSN